jgi:hypothetical protein
MSAAGIPGLQAGEDVKMGDTRLREPVIIVTPSVAAPGTGVTFAITCGTRAADEDPG